MNTKISDYLELMRFDKPIGWLLLLWPTLAALWLASDGFPSTKLIWIFALGVVVMRSAGCVINDYADRDLDPHVERTTSRPLASGRVTPKEALCLFVGLSLLALLLLVMLPQQVWPWSIPALFFTIIYPFMKRFFQAPQLVLGIAFSFSIPMVYTAVGQEYDLTFWLLVATNILWVLVYDTAYAMSDRDDDLKIGVKSTAILFGKADRFIIGSLQCLVVGAWCVIAYLNNLNAGMYASIAIAAAMFIYQQKLIADRDRELCFRAFINNGWLGGVIWFGLLSSAH